MKFEKLNEIERSAIIDYLKDRYGIEKRVFRNFEFLKHGKKIWIATKGIEHSLNLRVESIGLMFMRIEKNKIKLSTNAAQLFGKFAKKNVVELDDKSLYEALRGLDLSLESNAEDGYVLLKYKDDIIGVGQKRGKFIKNMIPKAKRIKKF